MLEQTIKDSGLDLTAVDLVKAAVKEDPALKLQYEATGAKIEDLSVDQFMKISDSLPKAQFADLTARIAKTIIQSPEFKNPLSVLFGEDLKYGASVQDIYTGMVPSEAFDPDSKALMDSRKIKAQEFIYENEINKKYAVTISAPQTLGAFTNEQALSNYLNQVVEQMHTAREIDEFTNSLVPVQDAILSNESEIKPIDMSGDVKEANDNLLVEVMNASDRLQFPNRSNGAQVIMTTPKHDQVLLVTQSVYNNLKVRTFSGAFNLDQLGLDPEMITPLPSLGVDANGNKVLAVLVDRKKFLYNRKLDQVETFYNPDTLTSTYFLHYWVMFNRSQFRNMITFVDSKDESVGQVLKFQNKTVTITEGTSFKDGLLVTNFGSVADKVKDAHIAVLAGSQNADSLSAFVADASAEGGKPDATKAVTAGYLNVVPHFDEEYVDISANKLPAGREQAVQTVGLFNSEGTLLDSVVVIVRKAVLN